ncbi:thiol-disulfide isomerase/thioredoxin [Pedobacter duraquae]|uniref:Thiol-disulfide isomerase/thioredoxin n=2 Tax=Pedobacter duraquae TaxID=425511 RepID=A0A4R6ICB8_9SPHI|nr:thiol-disulfide isomerase/thioredoxin [Pedobacter duraquae]
MDLAMVKKNGWNIFFVIILLVIVFVPSSKALVLRGLMEIGLFKPGISAPAENSVVSGLAGIRFKNATGKVVDLGSLKGKVVFLNFWATWCPPCQAEMPSVNKLYQRFKNDPNVVFILVDGDSNLPKAQQYMNRKKFDLPVYEVDSAIPEQLFKGSLPTTVVFDKEGRISYNEEGAANYNSKKFVEFIQQLILM